ncbi:MAG TPA: EamA family transporter [Thermoplasmata archaeon]|nr:EamA family transporter [Thermoplasmata archaeon]
MAVPAWLALASFDMTAWGVGQVVVKRATDRLGAVTMVLLASLLDGAGYVVLFLLFGGPFAASLATYAFAALSGITGMAGYILYYEALLRGNVSVVATITAGSPVITILGAIAFFGEVPSLAQGIGMALLVSAVLILSYEPIGDDWKVPVAVVLSVAILVLWGVWGLFTKAAVEDPGLGPWNILLFYAAANASMGFPYYIWRRKRDRASAPSRGAYGLGVLGLGTLFCGIVALTFALSVGPASLATAVSGSAPVVTALVAFAFLRERPTPWRIGALALFVPGIVLVAF